MAKQLVNFRNTNDFAVVDPRKGKTAGGLIWSSCGNTSSGGGSFKPSGSGGGGVKFQTAYGPSYLEQQLKDIGGGIFLMGVMWTFSIVLAPVGAGAMITGALMAMSTMGMKWVTFSIPCHEKEKPDQDYHELTFQEFDNLYGTSGSNNAVEMEAN